MQCQFVEEYSRTDYNSYFNHSITPFIRTVTMVKNKLFFFVCIPVEWHTCLIKQTASRSLTYWGEFNSLSSSELLILNYFIKHSLIIAFDSD